MKFHKKSTFRSSRSPPYAIRPALPPSHSTTNYALPLTTSTSPTSRCTHNRPPLTTFVRLRSLPLHLPSSPTPYPRRLKSPCTTKTTLWACSSACGPWILQREILIPSFLLLPCQLLFHPLLFHPLLFHPLLFRPLLFRPLLFRPLILRRRLPRESPSPSCLHQLPHALVSAAQNKGALKSAAASALSHANAPSTARGRTGLRTRSRAGKTKRCISRR